MNTNDIHSSELQTIENINFDNGNAKDIIFSQLYKYLYGFCDKNCIITFLHDHFEKGHSGFCTNKWLEETVAIKCYDCEYDGTCAICLDCFFDSDHKGHEYRLTRTSGGCCDCGDVSSWDVKGSCSVHTNSSYFDERSTLDPFTNSFLLRLEFLTHHIIDHVSEYLHNINVVNGETLQILVLFLNDLSNIAPAYRFSINLCLSYEVLNDWMLRHQILPSDLQKAFNSLYLTMITSLSFKRKFASLFAGLYVDIVQPLKEIQDDWHLSNLSVQLFTYSNIALDLVQTSFMDSCIKPVLDRMLMDNRLNTLQFMRFDRKKFNLYIRIISDLTYLMNHTAVCHLLLSNDELQNTVFNLFFFHNFMNLIERETKTHVTFENTGYSISFTVEHSLHSAFKPLSDYIKSIEESNMHLVLGFYKNFSDFIKKNALGISFNTQKLTRSFHIPLVRFFTSVIDFNLVRRYAKYYLRKMASTDKTVANYLNGSFQNLVSDENLDIDLFDLFDNDVLKYVLKSSLNVLKFAMEINHNLWIYNGESMHDQRTTYYELLFDSFDISSIQISLVLLGIKNLKDNFDILSYIFDICFDLGDCDHESLNQVIEKYSNERQTIDSIIESELALTTMVMDELMSNTESSIETMDEHDDAALEESEINTDMIDTYIPDAEEVEIDVENQVCEKHDPGNFEFKMMFFYIVLNTIVNDIKHLEVQSVSRKTTKEWFIKRGYPLMLMDIVYSLASGNVEFGQIVKATRKHWKHHPMFIETIEQVAIFNYSKVSDKTYIRLKPESYKLIDILWNTNLPATHMISKELLVHDVSLLGPTDVEVMAPEYKETQALILNSISCNMLFNYVLLLMADFVNVELSLDVSDFESLTDLFDVESKNAEKFELARKMVHCSQYKFSSCSHQVLYSLKILNLLYKCLPKPSKATGVLLVSCINGMLKRMDDEVYKKCTNYTLATLNKLYGFEDSFDGSESQTLKINVKLLQKKFLQRLSKQNLKFTAELESKDVGTSGNEKFGVCILCKRNMDNETSMSCMCFISSNNVLRRCCSSNGLSMSKKAYVRESCDVLGPDGKKFIKCSSFTTKHEDSELNDGTDSNSYNQLKNDKHLNKDKIHKIAEMGESDVIFFQTEPNYGIYAKSSLPLSSSIITSCGHIAHTRCIKRHRELQDQSELFSLYGIQNSAFEFLCPMCKSLCNTTLKIIPDSKMEKYDVSQSENVKWYAYSKKNKPQQMVSRPLGDDAMMEPEPLEEESNHEHEFSDYSDYENLLFLETYRNSDVYDYNLCVISCRYHFTNNWLPCPVYANYEKYQKYIYALNVLSTSKNVNYYRNTESNHSIDVFAFPHNAHFRNVDCSYCSQFDFDSMDIDSYKCTAFMNYKNVLVPKLKVYEKERVIKIQGVYKYLMKNWNRLKTTSVYNIINATGSDLDYTEMFPRRLVSSYALALFSDQRKYFGIRNWRHVNVGLFMDPKFWVFYNEILSTCSLRRNTLNIPNSFFSQIVRNYYFSNNARVKSGNFSLYVLEFNEVSLSGSYYDFFDSNVETALPDVSLYNDELLEKNTNMIRVFVESLDEEALSQFYNLCCDKDSDSLETSYYDVNNSPDEFFENVNNSVHEYFRKYRLHPLRTYLAKTWKSNPYSMFANEMPLSPWSYDYMKEFLSQFLFHRTYTRSDLIDHLYFYLFVGTLQVLDRFIIDIMRENYKKFVDECSESDESLMKTKKKRDFVTIYTQRFFKDLLDNAEFPCDVVSRCAFMDFDKNREAFIKYNLKLTSSASYESNLHEYDLESLYSSQSFKETSDDTLNTILSEIITFSSMMKSIHHKHVESIVEPIPYEKLICRGGETMIQMDTLYEYMLGQVSRIIKVREIHNILNNKCDVQSMLQAIEGLSKDSNSPKRQRLDSSTHVDKADSEYSVFKETVKISHNSPCKSNHEYLYKGVDLARRLNNLLYRSHTNTVFFETIKHNIPDSLHILDFVDSDFMGAISRIDFSLCKSYLSVIERVFKYTIGYFIKQGFINCELLIPSQAYKIKTDVLNESSGVASANVQSNTMNVDNPQLNSTMQNDIKEFKLFCQSNAPNTRCDTNTMGCDGQINKEDADKPLLSKSNNSEPSVTYIEDELFSKFKSQMFESLNLFLDAVFWTINSIFKYDNEICTKVLYGHLNSDETRFNLLIEALGIGPCSNLKRPCEVLSELFSPTYQKQMILNRNCNMEVTPPIISKYNLIDLERHLTELHWGMIKKTAFRACANCGLKPSNPVLCLLCGSLLCSNNECCHRAKTSQDTRFVSKLKKKFPELNNGVFERIYEEEIVAHSSVCGGGQCIYFSPYHCCVVLVDNKRSCTIPSIYSDKYGNSDLHGKVYGEVKLTKARLDNIVNMFCSGRLSNEIVSQRKMLLHQLT